MVEVQDSSSSPVQSAAITTTTNRAYEITKQGGALDSRHEYELIGTTSSPAGNSVEEVYEIPSVSTAYQPHPVVPGTATNQ